MLLPKTMGFPMRLGTPALIKQLCWMEAAPSLSPSVSPLPLFPPLTLGSILHPAALSRSFLAIVNIMCNQLPDGSSDNSEGPRSGRAPELLRSSHTSLRVGGLAGP